MALIEHLITTVTCCELENPGQRGKASSSTASSLALNQSQRRKEKIGKDQGGGDGGGWHALDGFVSSSGDASF